MCGIVGQFNAHSQVNHDIFDKMTDSLFHRGPDARGVTYFENETAAFGHRRLSIIDLTKSGSQPMPNETQTIWITFNGEIYNYKSLKKELSRKGVVFISNSDTEVILKGYEFWGLDTLLSKLKGMFAFGIWDSNTKKLHLARDRFGMKPLYYYFDENKFCFASELKAIYIDPSKRKKLNEDAIADFFIYSYVPNPYTIWEDSFKLPPAHVLSYDFKTHTHNVKQYWKLETSEKIISWNEAVEQTNYLINQSVSDHMESDVPVGLFLSGGYDSSTILTHMSKQNYSPNTFSIGFENSDRSEHAVSAKIAKHFNTNHHELILGDNKDYFEDLRRLAYYYDEPFAVSSMLPYYYVSQLATADNKVALAGDGGDEAFAGYRWQKAIRNRFVNPTAKQKIKDILLGQKGRDNSFLYRYNQSMTGILKKNPTPNFLNPKILSKIKTRDLWLFQKSLTDIKDPLKKCQYLDYLTFIPEPALTRADRSSMANSLEVRVPFLDHEIYEFTFGLNSSCYFKEGQKKPLLEENLLGQVPEEILKMPKFGFSFQKLESIFDERFHDLLQNGNLISFGILNKDTNINTLPPNSKFHLLMLEFWFEHYN